MKNNGLLCIVLLLLVSCTPQFHDHSLRIVTSNWIGYLPLVYANEKGSLDQIDVKLTNVISPGEIVHLYKSGNYDAFCATQYELSILQPEIPNLIPVLLFDRSHGGDLIMSNHTVSELQNSASKIDTYLEIDSVNSVVLKDFIQKYEIDESRINYINMDQTEISTLKNTESNKLVLIITYIPYDSMLKENGFIEILSTKNGLDLLVIDALFTQSEMIIEHKEQFTALKKLIDEAIETLHANPKEFYETIKPYIPELTYEEFIQELNDIIWLNKELDQALKIRLQDSSFPIKDLL